MSNIFDVFLLFLKEKNTHSDALHKHARRKSHRQCNVFVLGLDIFVYRFRLTICNCFLRGLCRVVCFCRFQNGENFNHQYWAFRALAYSNLTRWIPVENQLNTAPISIQYAEILQRKAIYRYWISLKRKKSPIKKTPANWIRRVCLSRSH